MMILQQVTIDGRKINFEHLERCKKYSANNAHENIHQMTFSPMMKCCIQLKEALCLRHTIKTSRLNMG